MIRKRNGEKLRPHQFANDWISADTKDGRPVIVKPTAVQLEPEDMPMFTPPADPYSPEARRVGHFWLMWELHDDGTFTRRQPVEQVAEPAGQ